MAEQLTAEQLQGQFGAGLEAAARNLGVSCNTLRQASTVSVMGMCSRFWATKAASADRPTHTERQYHAAGGAGAFFTCRYPARCTVPNCTACAQASSGGPGFASMRTSPTIMWRK